MTVPARKRRAPQPWPWPSWRVTVGSHDIPPRWHVPARIVEVMAPTAEGARETVARWACIDAKVPPLRSLTAVVLVHTTVERVRAPAEVVAIDVVAERRPEQQQLNLRVAA